VRVSVSNQSSTAVDLSTATDNLVLVLDSQASDDAQPLPGTTPNLHLYSLGGSDSSVTVGTKEHVIAWKGGVLQPQQSFTSNRPDRNGFDYQFPPLKPRPKTDVDLDIAPKKLHVLGLGWLNDDGGVDGFTPVSAWKGPNNIDSFLRK
jgi:hypothetical protein